MRRLIVGAALALAAPALMAFLPVASASAATPCGSNPQFVITNNRGAVMTVGAVSGDDVVVTKSGAETFFCQVRQVNNIFTIYEAGHQNLCLSASNGLADVTSACTGSAAEWNEIVSKSYSGDILLQWWASRNCAYQAGDQPAKVDLQACVDKFGTTGDVWRI